MKRLLLVTAILVPVVLLALPAYIGQQTEQRYRELASDAGAAGLTLAGFERGWFRSRARWRFDPPAPALGAFSGDSGENASLALADHIAHGPLPLAARAPEARWRPALVVVETATVPPSGAPRQVSRFKLLMDGSVAGESRPGALRVVLPVAGSLALDEPALDYRANSRMDRFEARLGAGGLALEKLSASGLRLALEGRRAPAGLWLGSADGDIVEIALGGGDGFQVGALSLEGAATQEGPVMSARLQATAQSARGPNHAYGPARLALSLDDLDAGSLARLKDTALRLAGQGLEGRGLQMALVGALYAEAPRLLAHRPRLALEDLRVDTPDGPLTATGHLSLASAERRVLDNPWLLQRAVVADFRARVPMPVSERLARLYLAHRPGTPPPGEAGEWLARLVRDGALVAVDDAYRIRARYESGRLTVNGRPWPPEPAPPP